MQNVVVVNLLFRKVAVVSDIIRITAVIIIKLPTLTYQRVRGYSQLQLVEVEEVSVVR